MGRAGRLAGALLFCALATAQAQPPQPTADADEAVARALRAALLGDANGLDELAAEHALVKRGSKDAPRLAENIAALGAATRRPAPDHDAARAIVHAHGKDFETRAFLELAKASSPADRFRSARASRRYENLRRVVNSMTNAVAGVLTLQFFALLQPPLDLVQHLSVDQKVLNPEQRRQLFEARRALDASPGAALRREAEQTIASLGPARVELAALQARRNAERSAARGLPRASDWWSRREMLLLGRMEPFRPGHIEVLQALSRRGLEANEAMSVLPGEDLLKTTAQFAAYGRLVSQFVRDPSADFTLELARRFQAQHPLSPAADDARFLEVVHAHKRDLPDLTRVSLRFIARRDKASSWATRSEAYLQRVEFNPEHALQEAAAAVARRRLDFVLTGADPRPAQRHLTPEAARQQTAGWITAARSAFVLDILGRAVACPLLAPSLFSREEVFEAIETTPERFLGSVDGERWLRRAARDYAAQKRLDDAARCLRRAGDERAARRMEARHVRQQVKLLGATGDPARRLAELERLAEEFPATSEQPRLDAAIAQATRELDVLMVLTPQQARALLRQWGDNALLPASLFDGDRSNGEASRDGASILEGDRLAYTDKSTGAWVEIELPEGGGLALAEQSLPVRRTAAVRDFLARPDERKRIPLALEGGVAPGFDIAPALVPLDVDRRERRLYE